MVCSVASATNITVIFASSYPGNPASLFGHTMLRVHRSSATAEQPLLDEGIGFAADVDTDNALLYAIKGLFGGFRV